MYDESDVVVMATIVAIFDILFIIFMVPERLAEILVPTNITSNMFSKVPTATTSDSSYICSRQAHKRMKICTLFPRNMFTTIIDFYKLKTAKSLMYNKSVV